MKYWEEYRSKWGFGDGDAVPPDAWALRYVYVLEINRMAAKLGSAVRLVAYDRGGMHNPHLISRVTADMAEGVPETGLCKGSMCGGWVPGGGNWTEPADDDAMRAAVEEALERDDIDDLVDVDVTFTDGSDETCHVAA